VSGASAITIVGTGPVGTNLAVGLADLGLRLTFAVRDSSSDKTRAAVERVDANVVPLAEAAHGADFVVLAVPYAAVASTVSAIGDLGDAVVIDATNTVGVSLPPGVTTIADVIAAANPSAVIVKAFNTIGAENFLRPAVDGTPLFLPIAGDPGAVERVGELATAMGFDALVIGDRSSIHLVEAFAALWIHLAFRTGLGRDFGFARLSR
jgi:predicted dinucleotide-binding enzyme